MLFALSEILWGVPVMGLLLAAGICLTVHNRFVQVRKLGASFHFVGESLRRPANGVSSFQAVCTALAATVGTGNIAGVAGALALGGPGAVFWMWVAAFFGMATKYAEIVLAMKYRKKDAEGQWQGGPMYYIQEGLGSKTAARGFALFAILASFGMGNMVQVNTISAAVVSAAEVYAPGLRAEPVALFTGLAAALLVLPVILGGAERIGRVMAYLVPVVSGIYILGSGAVLVSCADRLPEAFLQIFRGAFQPAAVLGGGVGIGLRQAVRWGVSRGIFSNEAGLGSAPMAYVASNAEAREQGLMGIFEVFLDTVVLCTLTALTILVSGVPIPYGAAAGADLATRALSTVFGAWSEGLMALCLTLLALATVVSWQLYGSRCAVYLFGKKGSEVYSVLYLGVMVLGATMKLEAVWSFSDVCNGLMALPNLTALLILKKETSP